MISQGLIRCPVCISKLNTLGTQLKCTNRKCAAIYPIVDGVPILINEAMSVFSLSDFTTQKSLIPESKQSEWKKIVWRLIPSISKNIRAGENYDRLTELLLASTPVPRVLVIGGRVIGEGMEKLAASRLIELIETDVAFGPRTSIVCDAHCLPFEDNSFDGVIAQAVLEHVVDPIRCVDQFHRVLKNGGLVYAETPFIAQVHMGAHDFTRFTHLGHRRLFRHFDEIESGAVCGPGMALAWSYRYFLLSFASSKTLRMLIHIFAGFTSFFLKYFDLFLIDKRGVYDAALGYFFIGKKGNNILSDRDLMKLYRGAG